MDQTFSGGASINELPVTVKTKSELEGGRDAGVVIIVVEAKEVNAICDAR